MSGLGLSGASGFEIVIAGAYYFGAPKSLAQVQPKRLSKNGDAERGSA
jgi:hypothetical protein